MQSLMDSLAFKQAMMRYFYEAFFELIICSGVGWKMFEIRSIWNTKDKIAFSILVVMLAATFAFLLLMLKFILCNKREMIKDKRLIKKQKQRILIYKTLNNEIQTLQR